MKKCPKCNKVYQDFADTCPKCNVDLNTGEEQRRAKKGRLGKIVETLGIILLAIVLIALLWGILIMLPIIGWAVALILTIVIITTLVSFLAGRKSKG